MSHMPQLHENDSSTRVMGLQFVHAPRARLHDAQVGPCSDDERARAHHDDVRGVGPGPRREWGRTSPTVPCASATGAL